MLCNLSHIFLKFVLLLIHYFVKMKKLLLSVAALMVATLLFSQDDTSEVNDDVSQDTSVVLVDDTGLSS